ncbi:multidrug efflux SMR transporter [Frigoribacterium sp. CG_9.8]|uniref:DMT family transporter n=1 Tax=Frigoribacterium sp. CG_9.8 TaxID=2787733 RepID=UPI0018C9C6FB|nr:multidrug efflux SMR transporter [Frigoribacterium sp. CG_9.8]MBG6107616.1 small multidrug resistance pump [Frigoribacterium sp. CG_9.8]
MGYLFLAGAIVAEVIATTALKFATGDGANRILAYAIVTLGYIAAFAMLSQSLTQGVPLGIAYAIWAGVGVVLVVVISWIFFKEPLTLVQIGGMVLVIGGVAMLELGGKH